ncbi:hypothetical protein QE152_g6975 [Popillia japonica]|uniref:Uncharacterized protein n=1 Tax=Popillia japonica TaxID=7064 RepID=A0AAW1MI61_POPJA
MCVTTHSPTYRGLPPYNPDMSRKVDIVKQLFTTEKRTRQRGKCKFAEVLLFEKEELTSAVKKIKTGKAPGPNR